MADKILPPTKTLVTEGVQALSELWDAHLSAWWVFLHSSEKGLNINFPSYPSGELLWTLQLAVTAVTHQQCKPAAFLQHITSNQQTQLHLKAEIKLGMGES